MFTDLQYDAKIAEVTYAMSHGGVFLTTSHQGRDNTMTIGWGSIGYYWGKPIFTVVVRNSRHSFNLLENSGEFTVSIPLDGSMREELRLCGTSSGRDIDKFAAYNLKTQAGTQVKVPIITQCDLHYECRVVYKSAMDPNQLAVDLDQRWYPQRDYHTFYHGEILACYGR